MSKTKTRGDRESAIETLHNEIKTHAGFECAAVDALRNKLKRQLSAWYEIIKGDYQIVINKMGAVNALFVKHGVQVLFAGGRTNAIAAYRSMIRQAVICDYTRFIVGCGVCRNGSK